MPEKKKKQHDKDEEEVSDIIEDEKERASTLNPQVKKLKEKLKECLNEREEYLDGWQRTKADFINYKGKEEERQKEAIRYAKEDILTQLLPVIDSFEMAFLNKEVWESVDKNWRSGIEHIYSQLSGTLKENGMTQIHPLNEPFDPNVHESVEVRKVDSKEKEGIIVEVVQKGYLLHDSVVRPARVIVGEYTLDA